MELARGAPLLSLNSILVCVGYSGVDGPPMNECYGVAGRTHRHLPHQQGRVRRHAAGPFAATLAPTPTQRQRDTAPTELFLALLTEPPNADGREHRELICEGYSRQRMQLVNFNTSFIAGSHRITFQTPNGAGATHVGAFDSAGELLYYGFLSSAREAAAPTRTFEFPPFSLMLRKAR